MKKKAVKLFALFLSMFFLLGFLTLPKFLVFDQILLKRGLYLTAERVEEGLFGFELRRGSLYGREKRLLTFDSMRVKLRPFYVSLDLNCNKGSLSIRRSFGGLELRAQNFGCLEGLGVVSADLRVSEGIRGKIELFGTKVQGLSLDRLEVSFKGRTFSAKAKAMGFELLGEGQVVPDPKDPLATKVNGQVLGGGLRLVISGSLYNLSVSR
ncbi:MAG: hypothetical protein D6699_07630 [Aquificota bacterium]|nr:MAG: hypothetical protein D6699_07630 [Aquificota bacterium]